MGVASVGIVGPRTGPAGAEAVAVGAKEGLSVRPLVALFGAMFSVIFESLASILLGLFVRELWGD